MNQAKSLLLPVCYKREYAIAEFAINKYDCSSDLDIAIVQLLLLKYLKLSLEKQWTH